MAKIPKEFQSALWSYDISKLDSERDANLIITQLLNYGNKKAKRWVSENYADGKIKEVLSHPQRGVWNRDVLREMLNKEDLIIDPLEYEAAIRNLTASPTLIKEVWKRKGFLT